LGRQDCDISEPASIEAAINECKPWAIINAAGYVRVDQAETDQESCLRDNTRGAANLARACNKAGIPLLTFSSDLVFDGKKMHPYIESDATSPLNVYGESKARAEQLVQEIYPSALVVRTSAFFSPWDEYNFAHYVRRSLSMDVPITVANDMEVSPTYVPDLVNAALDLLIDQESGIWHLANKGSLTWADWALQTAEAFQLDKSLIHSVSREEIDYPAPRPAYSVLGTERGQLLPTLEEALQQYFRKQKREERKVA
jgi:dTDP-4-dehydrorhamnose reductase